MEEELNRACKLLKEVRDSGGSLLILTGAGMSVSSGVPVFRHSDGSMSPDFLRFLNDYNKARTKHGLPEADDWFDFSVPQMFEKETEIEAWRYWRWRILRALVEPADDYQMLRRIGEYFGSNKVFVVTSNCDQLHLRSGTNPAFLKEIHGSLGTIQCSHACCRDLFPVDDEFLDKLRNVDDPDWVPRCPKCKVNCLRPNVMIFGDDCLVYTKLREQDENYYKFVNKSGSNFVALEIGAGNVVSSIRYEAERKGQQGKGMIRINPSTEECADCTLEGSKYIPIPAASNTALEGLCNGLNV